MARKMQPGDRWTKAADSFEELVADGRMQWRDATVEELPNDWARMVVREFLNTHRLKWQLGSVQIEGAVCIKVEDRFLQYMDIFPNQTWMWCTDDHHSGVHPDRALEYLMAMAGTPARVVDIAPGMQRLEAFGRTVGLFFRENGPPEDE